MCGIAGFAHTDGSALAAPADRILRDMARALRPRGPDDMQFHHTDQACMSFTRLALIDPEGGRQPFISEDGNVILACNGEIYNYKELRKAFEGRAKFRSESDCEVLLHLYMDKGLDFLDDVRGMFGIAVIDLREQRLLLARDRLGIKPLFIHRRGATVLFGSEIKALFAHPECPREVDWARSLADQGLSAAPVMVDDEPVTWFKGVDHVPSGAIMSIGLRDGATRVHRYWDLPTPAEAGDLPESYFVQSMGDLLASSVRECLTADAEIGVFLSGGLDSAAITALAAHTELHTFSALTGSTVVNKDAQYAQETASLLGLPHHQVAFGADRVPSPDEWRRLLWLMETPQCGPEQFYKSEMYRFARAERSELKAILLGSGADEFSGGYSVSLSGNGDWEDFEANLRTLARRKALGTQSPVAIWWEGTDLPLLSDDAVNAYVPDAVDDPYGAYLAWKFRDMQQYNFWVEDRTASGNGVEARVPFLDHRIIELLASVPRSYRKRLFWDKQVIREAVQDVLPAEVISRPKLAFYEGEGVRHTHRTFTRMLALGGDELVEEALSSPRAAQYLDGGNIRGALRRLEHNQGSGHVELLLRVINLGLLDVMTVNVPGSRPAPGPAPYELRVSDFEGPQIQELFPRTRIEETTVLRLADGVLVLDDSQEAKTSYVVIDGTVRFVIDQLTHADWLRLLRAFDGRLPLAEAATEADCDLSALRPLLDESLEAGLLEAVPRAAPAAG
ncbi:asparagine synthase (glutamine-hydrolyzing) [Wenjunlia tyrosinilytica]|uniref:asparagine synthase (glutamine-hydrolyzing) n=1 Tax=Wenjunlia tyrosinilytica TaxID=1544741 RepID=A0A917ZEV5_9ACTN|nr:asparagine synthase (glutamine-hydrolyzing) [Wenjunlia tyrosinilytica]GGO82100.1 asparagine synthetase [glutamine-hydrolyzing] 2 [Wenjunlia tyrosinilytica]